MRSLEVIVSILIALLSWAGTASAKDIRDPSRGVRVPVGITFISGWLDVVDFHENAEGTSADLTIPMGLSVHPYYQFVHGSRVGLDVGPIAMIIGDTEFFLIPIGATYGFSILPRKAFTPFVRAGFRYPIASGEYVEGSTPGIYLATGVEFLRNGPVGVGLEVAFDSSTVTFEDTQFFRGGWRTIEEEIAIMRFMAGVRALF